MGGERDALRMLRVLRRNSKRVLQHLNARIDAAPRDAVPVFNGIAELNSALLRTDAFLRGLKDPAPTSKQKDGQDER